MFHVLLEFGCHIRVLLVRNRNCMQAVLRQRVFVNLHQVFLHLNRLILHGVNPWTNILREQLALSQGAPFFFGFRDTFGGPCFQKKFRSPGLQSSGNSSLLSWLEPGHPSHRFPSIRIFFSAIFHQARPCRLGCDDLGLLPRPLFLTPLDQVHPVFLPCARLIRQRWVAVLQRTDHTPSS